MPHLHCRSRSVEKLGILCQTPFAERILEHIGQFLEKSELAVKFAHSLKLSPDHTVHAALVRFFFAFKREKTVLLSFIV